MTDTTNQYTETQYTLLSEEQTRALVLVAERLGIDPKSPEGNLAAMDDDDLSSTFNILRPCDGCVPPEECDGDDGAIGAIDRKFRCLLGAACEMAETGSLRVPEGTLFWYLIDPSHDGYTRRVVVSFDHEKPWCYYNESDKAWTVGFETLEAIANEVMRIRDCIVAGYQRCEVIGESAQHAIAKLVEKLEEAAGCE